MYDQLNDSNNSNDGRNVKHVQKRPQKGKWSKKSGDGRSKKTTGLSETEAQRNRCGQCGTQTGQDNTCFQPER